MNQLSQEHDRVVGRLKAALGDAEARLQRSTGGSGESESRSSAAREVEQLRGAIRELNSKYGAARHEYEVAVGMRKDAAFGPPRSIGTGQRFSTFEEKLRAYDEAVDLLKAAGPVAALSIARGLRAEVLENRPIDAEDRASMTRISRAGRDAMALGRMTLPAANSGAASPAPGVDHRRAATAPPPGPHAALQNDRH
ncbi:MAG: hypothetical protein R3B13_08050 [Polyangiaceae bacterium]